MILAGDIGGTKVMLALYARNGKGPVERSKQLFKCAEYECLGDIIHEFLLAQQEPENDIETAAFAIAGPVENGRCKVTNLPWIVDASQIASRFGLKRVQLLNDLEALARSVPHLSQDDLVVLNKGRPVGDGAIGVVAPGTGLGEAFLVRTESGYKALPSEGGHSDMAPNNALELELTEYLLAKYEHASYERVISGEGIANIYNFFKESGNAAEPDWLAEKIAGTSDPNPIIVAHSHGEESVEICSKTMETFISVLGAEAGNLALKVLARGGVYLAGGIPPKIMPLLQSDRFVQSFYCKGRMSELVKSMPLYVITHPEPALLGAAWYAATQF